ncbi:MAG: hypothetical protein KDD66_05485 [Bdellovibrionales bacterium]|nr:hypothetical protein [Bdellovibrionales bacterium]
MGIFEDLTIEIKRDLEGLWRWTKLSNEGKVVANAEYGFSSCLACYQAAYKTSSSKPLMSAADENGWINCAELPARAFAGLR